MSKFAHTEELEFVVPADQYTSMQDFSAFLYRMKSLYTYTFEESELFEQEEDYLHDVFMNQGDIDQLDPQFVADFEDELKTSNFNDIRFRYFSKDLGEDDIYIKEVENGSFIFTLSAAGLAMVFVFGLLVFITGGSLEMKHNKIKMEAGTTLGEGLKDLKEFLRK